MTACLSAMIDVLSVNSFSHHLAAMVACQENKEQTIYMHILLSTVTLVTLSQSKIQKYSHFLDLLKT